MGRSLTLEKGCFHCLVSVSKVKHGEAISRYEDYDEIGAETSNGEGVCFRDVPCRTMTPRVLRQYCALALKHSWLSEQRGNAWAMVRR